MKSFQVNLCRYKWSENNEGLRLSGSAYLADQLVGPNDFSRIVDSNGFVQAINSLNGFFSVVVELDNRIIIGVDHVRSMPLFYGESQGKFFVSDCAEWVRDKVGCTEMDSLAREEFLKAGYVTGPDTLYDGVKQVQAGECITIENVLGEHKKEKRRYYQFLHSDRKCNDNESFSSRLESAMLKCIGRLLEFSRGRKLVLPLSGGYDSRLIATFLKRAGCENVLCFTYGIKGNMESRISRSVAESLGYQWVFIEYSNKRWMQEWSSVEAEKYRNMSSNCCSLPHVQDWLAIKLLIEQGEVDENSVMVPGHTGDFIGGGHIPKLAFEGGAVGDEQLIQSIIESHYNNAPQSEVRALKPDGGVIEKRVMSRIGYACDGTSEEFANLYEMWEWQERQSKYIVNSVRVYDQFGIDWWLPLWDKEMVSFWEQVPLEFRKDRCFFKDWIDAEYLKQVGGSTMPTFSKSKGKAARLKSVFKRVYTLLPVKVKLPIKRVYRILTFRSHFLGFWALVPSNEQKKYIAKGYSFIGAYSDLYLKGRWGNDLDK